MLEDCLGPLTSWHLALALSLFTFFLASVSAFRIFPMPLMMFIWVSMDFRSKRTWGQEQRSEKCVGSCLL